MSPGVPVGTGTIGWGSRPILLRILCAMRTHRLAPAVLAAGLALLAAAAPAAATPPDPAGTTPTRSGYVVVRTPSVATYTPTFKDRGNSEGGVNTVQRLATGTWRITMPNLGSSLGLVQVTPMDSRLRRCFVTNWGGVVDMQIDIGCTLRNGDPVDTRFAVTFTDGTGGDGGALGRMGYVHNNAPFASSTPVYQYNSAIDTNDIVRQGVGSYVVVMPAIGVVGGNVQVSSYQSLAGCRAGAWGPNGATEEVTVVCRTPGGAPTDAQWQMLFLSKLGIEGYGTDRQTAHLWANKPEASSYRPAQLYRFSTAGRPITITRSGPGTYTVTLRGQPAGGVALVTAYGLGSDRFCQLTSIMKRTAPQRIGVACFRPDGTRADARFNLTWAK